MGDTAGFLAHLAAHGPAVLVTVDTVQGSGPREVGAWMAVFGDARVFGTVGGGQLEHEALAWARERLGQAHTGAERRRFALGPSLGQCCGGVVHLRLEPVTAADAATLRTRLEPRRHAVALFGGGHVGRAIATVLARLPVRLQWFDSRDEIFPSGLPAHVVAEHSDPIEHALADVPDGAALLIMSFSHAEDLDIVAAALRRQRERGDLAFIGLIGSKTKWATFRQRLEARGFGPADLLHVTCPIGVPGIGGKQPEVIAVSVAAQLLALPAWNTSEN